MFVPKCNQVTNLSEAHMKRLKTILVMHLLFDFFFFYPILTYFH